MNIIQELFGKSPFGPLVEHTEKVHECVEVIRPLMEALVNEDYDEIRRLQDRVSRLVSLKSEKDIVEGYYLDMKIKLEDEKLKYRGSKDTTGINVWVFKKPVLPTKPDNSRKISLIFKGFWIALLCALALAYGVDRFKDPVCFDKDLTGMLNIQ
ncbi:MAG: DUF47 family protein, partial [Methanothrix sp.]